MVFAFGINEVSLLLGVFALVLMIASGLFSPYYGRVTILFSRRRLRNVALGTSILFLVTIAIRVLDAMLPS